MKELRVRQFRGVAHLPLAVLLASLGFSPRLVAQNKFVGEGYVTGAGSGIRSFGIATREGPDRRADPRYRVFGTLTTDRVTPFLQQYATSYNSCAGGTCVWEYIINVVPTNVCFVATLDADASPQTPGLPYERGSWSDAAYCTGSGPVIVPFEPTCIDGCFNEEPGSACC